MCRLHEFSSFVSDLYSKCYEFYASPFLQATETSGSAEKSDAEGDGGDEGKIGDRWYWPTYRTSNGH